MEERKAKYRELLEWLEGRIGEGELSPGDRVDSENELCDRFGLSRQTVRRALGILEDEGVVRRIKGSGTYVCDSRRTALENRTRIAVVTTYVDSYIFPKMIQGIESVLSGQGYSVEIAFTNNTVERERTVLEDILERDDAAGLILEAVKSGLPNPNMDLYEELIRRRVPVLFVNSYYPGLPFPHVCLDDRRTAGQAVDYLVEQGHRNIGAVLKLDDGQGHLRYAGYMDGMKRAGLPIDGRRIVWLDTQDMEEMEACGERIIKRLEGCTAVLCYNDQAAYQLLPLLGKAGLRVPEDVSLVSIDDSELALLTGVKLTSIPHPKEKLGERAALNLIRMMREPSFDGTYEFVEELRERDSVRRLPESGRV